MLEFSFIHAADLHLGAPFRGIRGDIASPGAFQTGKNQLAELLQKATFLALDRLVEACLRENVDFLLLAGDVYNSASSSLKARMALRDAFIRLQQAEIDVFLVHGNHDPYGEADSALPWPENVKVFGASAEALPVLLQNKKQGPDNAAPVAVVHGISHTSPKEGRNLAKLLQTQASLLDAGAFHIGLLHCALAGNSGSHEAYAPCTFSDLSASGMDYWALGHVHACCVFDAQGKTVDERQLQSQAEGSDAPLAQHPLAAYSGSVQGLHVNEDGPHGCLLVRASSANGKTWEHHARFLPLAPVQWERCSIEPGEDVQTVSGLERLVLEKLEALAPNANIPQDQRPLAVMVRLTLTGRSPLDHTLRGEDALSDFQEHLASELLGTGVWIRDIRLETRPVLNVAAMAGRSDLAGETLRVASALREELSPAFAEEVFAPLFKSKKARKAIAVPQDDEITALLEDAAYLCIDLLAPEADTAEDEQSGFDTYPAARSEDV